MTLKELRKKNNLNQEAVANFLGIKQHSYSNIESGKRKLSVNLAKKLGEFYNIDWWTLYED